MTNTLFVGKVYSTFDELTSTNDYALELLAGTTSGAAKSKPSEGTVIRTDRQTAGRGQFGSRWESESGANLTLSVILYPVWLPVHRQFGLSMAVALAVCDALEQALPEHRDALKIKWPNDIYLNNGKAGGILIQNALSGAMLQSSVVGIGLNVNQTAFDPTLPNPTSLLNFSGKKYDLDLLAENLFVSLERRYLHLKNGGAADICSEYTARLFRLGLETMFMNNATNEPFSGIIRGVADDGKLMIESNAKITAFDLKEIRLMIEVLADD